MKEFIADTIGQGRRSLWEDKFAERFHERVCDSASICGIATYNDNRYFPTVYEPTVFENYVHGKLPPNLIRIPNHFSSSPELR
jgi:hypothetical protein